jgi:flavodoxin
METTAAKALVVVYSYHHGNTEKVAHAIADVLGAAVKHPQDTTPEEISACGLVGFGAGIAEEKHYAPILALAEALLPVTGKRAFVLSTAGVTLKSHHAALKAILVAKGYTIVGEFRCPGFNTNSIYKYIGGLNRGRPNAKDLQKAGEFARGLEAYVD